MAALHSCFSKNTPAPDMFPNSHQELSETDIKRLHGSLLSDFQKYLTIHWMASAFRNFENTIVGFHGLSLYTPHHDIARCSCPKG